MAKEFSVLVTGASGFIATQTILDLLEAGHRVRGTLRSLNKADDVREALRAQTPMADMLELVEADLMSPEGWVSACEGCDVVLHIASPFPATLPKHADELIRTAREGTLAVLNAAEEAGVKRVVLTSSAAAVSYGYGDDLPELLTEANWSNPEHSTDNTAYTRSKTLAEQAAWEFISGEKSPGLELVVLNPALVLGPVISSATSTSLEVVSQLLTGKMPALPDLNFPIVDVRDVASAQLSAMALPEAAGKRFILVDSNLDLIEIAEILKETCPDRARKIATRSIPSWLVRLMAPLMPSLAHIRPDLGKMRKMSHGQMKSVLGISPIPARKSVEDAAKSLIAFHLV